MTTAYYHRTRPDTPTYRCPHCSAVVEDQTAHDRWHQQLAPAPGRCDLSTDGIGERIDCVLTAGHAGQHRSPSGAYWQLTSNTEDTT